MRLGRIEFGKVVYHERRKFLKLRYQKTHCLCHAFEFGYWYFTILGDECRNAKIEYGDVDILEDGDSE